ncbi:MAG: hypothetical protein QNK37_00650 [Acidobacteriota bacterium]|nr:hypothetical protein [Acidobacteriota bacterium]
MSLPFQKIQACGNDFVLLEEHPRPEDIALICDRHHGIGADGVLVFSSGEWGPVIDHYDPDGSRTLCLNGLRAALAALYEDGRVPIRGIAACEGSKLSYEIDPGVSLRLPCLPYEPHHWQPPDGGEAVRGFFAAVGNPHFITIESMDRARFRQTAPSIRADPSISAEGCNVNLLKRSGDIWRIVTYERGVEGCTLACGSGMYASALVLMGEFDLQSVTFQPEGHGTVTVTAAGSDLKFEGTTRRVAQGVWLC